ncbi:MAG: glycosyltransferase family 4 protein [Betaproteobacteria bacterium]|nr:glycosyltransferase family 4 protein [Betaproteobacteria bacterium]
MLNILYMHRTQAHGVEGVHIREIVKAWRRLGNAVVVVSPVKESPQDSSGDGGGAPRAGMMRRLMSAMSRRLPEILFECLEVAYNVVAYRQAATVRDTDFIFERYAIFAFAGSLLAARRRIPHIIEVNYTSRSELVRKRSALLAPLAFRIDKFIFSRATALAAVSSRLKEHLISEFGIPAERVIVLPNAADPEVFDPDKVTPASGLKDTGKWIGFVGGFYPWHGVGLLVDAFCRIADAVPDARLLLVGDGPMRAAIERQCATLNIANRVLMTGAVSHDRLPAYIRAFHVGVMPDSNDYGSPMKVFEYMALGTPVVAPAYGPLLDVMQDGREGRIFPPRDVAALADCLLEVLTRDDVHAQMSENARLAVVTRHNWMENARRLLAQLPGKS